MCISAYNCCLIDQCKHMLLVFVYNNVAKQPMKLLTTITTNYVLKLECQYETIFKN